MALEWACFMQLAVFRALENFTEEFCLSWILKDEWKFQPIRNPQVAQHGCRITNIVSRGWDGDLLERKLDRWVRETSGRPNM